MTDAEDLLLEIANSMSKDFADPVEHANWCVEEAKKYFANNYEPSDSAPIGNTAEDLRHMQTEAMKLK